MRKSFIVMIVMMVIAIAQLAAASSPMDSHQKQVAYMAIADVAVIPATMTEAKINSNMPFIAGAPAREFGRYSGARPDYKYLSVSADDFKAVMSFTVKPRIEGLGRYSGDKPVEISLSTNMGSGPFAYTIPGNQTNSMKVQEQYTEPWPTSLSQPNLKLSMNQGPLFTASATNVAFNQKEALPHSGHNAFGGING